MTDERGIAIPGDLWRAAEAEAQRRGENVDSVVLRLLRAYAEGDDSGQV